MRVELDLHQLVRNWFDLQYLSCGLATQETGGSYLGKLEPIQLWYLLIVDWPHKGQVAPSLVNFNRFRLRYLSCGLATQKTLAPS
jgi:hypothetical protein